GTAVLHRRVRLGVRDTACRRGLPDPVARSGGTCRRRDARTVSNPLLEVSDLKVQFKTREGLGRAVDGVDFTVERGQGVGIVGESGSGKSVTALTLLGLTRAPTTRFHGDVRYLGRSLLGLSEGELREVRGNRIAMIFQDPMTSLNPVFSIGNQIEEAILVHE